VESFFKGFLGIACLSDYLKLGITGEQGFETEADNFVIVDEDDS
jgi:hypothetical protein